MSRNRGSRGRFRTKVHRRAEHAVARRGDTVGRGASGGYRRPFRLRRRRRDDRADARRESRRGGARRAGVRQRRVRRGCGERAVARAAARRGPHRRACTRDQARRARSDGSVGGFVPKVSSVGRRGGDCPGLPRAPRRAASHAAIAGARAGRKGRRRGRRRWVLFHAADGAEGDARGRSRRGDPDHARRVRGVRARSRRRRRE